ncbi:hypothetical protein PENPOL_c001G04695 [Penicillium polonicum]|uniref:Xylanolytic transcriptional activator regulatory domain-containing protein n=1 Tax=Penicillium polonicum TaxID=60169 RepID=A0A1V6P1X8_PENPO|nr:hypothetical protein PENPOL_c001G04695 [Penicillium polonicum]
MRISADILRNADCTWPTLPAFEALQTTEHSQLVQHASRLERQVAELQNRLQSQRNESCTHEVAAHSISPVDYHGELSTDVVLLSMNAAAEPSFIGATSGFSLSRLVEGILSESMLTERVRGDDTTVSDQTPMQEQSVATDQEDVLVDTFFKRVHPRYPFLDEVSLQDLFRQTTRDEEHNSPNLFLLYMVYAIAARTIQLHPEMRPCTRPEAYFTRALRHIDSALASQCLQRVQALLLIALYLLRTPSNVSNLGSWHIIGLAIRHAVEMGLHRNFRDSRVRQLNKDDLNLRNRVFWSAYILDRAVSLTLGRPFALAEHEIDVPVHDSQKYQSFTHMCHLRRLESRIHREIFGADVHEASDEKIDCFRYELDAWLLAVPVPIDASFVLPGYSLYDTREFFNIQYSKALRMLLQRRITTPKKESEGEVSKTAEYIALSARASGDICQHYKVLHQRSPLGWNLLALHSIFTAGLTLLYSSWTRKDRPDLVALEDIRACSSVLFAISEQWPSTKRFRDIFETLAREMMDILQRSQPPDWNGLFPVDTNAFGGEGFWSIFDDLVEDDYIRDQFRLEEMMG